jgi:hypothetical protein
MWRYLGFLFFSVNIASAEPIDNSFSGGFSGGQFPTDNFAFSGRSFDEPGLGAVSPVLPEIFRHPDASPDPWTAFNQDAAPPTLPYWLPQYGADAQLQGYGFGRFYFRGYSNEYLQLNSADPRQFGTGTWRMGPRGQDAVITPAQFRAFSPSDLGPELQILIQSLQNISDQQLCRALLHEFWSRTEEDCRVLPSSAGYENIPETVFVEVSKSDDLSFRTIGFSTYLVGTSADLFRGARQPERYYNLTKIDLIYFLDFHGYPYLYSDIDYSFGYSDFETLLNNLGSITDATSPDDLRGQQRIRERLEQLVNQILRQEFHRVATQ